ncbi:related to Putative zinc metalloprotease TRE2 [Saccharomycodes ludwigii]|uniref:Related to Putative zinc metalloprotease TRE2 n=1 Tax=Saccharomycodes ludwigii TaxID=36035 RepID=A0A376B0V8_9ASCO|nr:hypothetical protein SCDLUD_002186 [Saccharomycodes ludwigii]KAH3902366.1 hypothetical protein SCDLUD_002186 [Saccharomycodes ludwigii]SSD58307.1 related to Putative zinc metalloprotease TRE2 [Saccharomycodes ludwigii]
MPRYERVNDTEDNDLPSNPPNYDDLEIGHSEEESDSEHQVLLNGSSNNENNDINNTTGVNLNNSGSLEAGVPPLMMDYEEEDGEEAEEETYDLRRRKLLDFCSKIKKMSYKFYTNLLIPIHETTVCPLIVFYGVLSRKIDFYLSKLGNPLIMRRFVYVVLMSVIAYIVTIIGLNKTDSGINGMFSDQDELLHYAKRCVDLAKFEQDLEYLSSMPHIAGTKGDLAIADYVYESFSNNGIKSVYKTSYQSYLNYASNASLVLKPRAGGEFKIDLSELNFNPLSTNGKQHDATLIYGGYGTWSDYEKLHNNMSIDFFQVIMVLKYGDLVSEQILIAQSHGVQGIIFISDGEDDDDDNIQMKGVGLPQFGTGDPLTPGWSSNLPNRIDLDKSLLVPKIPTIPLSRKQAVILKDMLEDIGEEWDDGWFTGDSHAILVDMEVETEADAFHPSWDIMAKIDGKEQNDKAIIIGAARDSACNGALYPNFSTAVLMSLVQLFQQIKYKYNWKPLRNIYFISYDASYYNYAGSTELLEDQLGRIKHEIYTYIDISQLGIGINELNIQCNPMLTDFFAKLNDKFDFHIKTENVHQYGNWIPYMSNGIPVVILASPENKKGETPLDSCSDTWKNLREVLYKEYKDGKGWDRTSRLILYTLEVVLKFVDDPIIPFNFATFVDNLKDIFEDLRSQISEINDENVSKLDLRSIESSLATWHSIVKEWEKVLDMWGQVVIEEGQNVEPNLISVHRWSWNRKLALTPTKQIDAGGLPGLRKFYKNVLFGPTLWTITDGEHDSWSFPGVRDAIHDKDWNRAQEQINAVSNALEQSAKFFRDESFTDV